MKKTEECSNCGHTARVERGNYQYRESGLPNVLLKNVEIIRCDNCGNEDPIIPRVNELTRVLAVAVIAKNDRLVGEEIRFLRKYLRMTGDEFGKLLKVDNATLSRWENNAQRPSEQNDMLIRAIAAALGKGLKQEIERIVRHFSSITEDPRPANIRVDPEKMEYEYAA
jgi:putative zinc finger/helix-turn-helix YgiT family protein